jgi:UDP-N-acetylmuramoyl-L-alanyl-D-glutamate--2,6-diaminopimelate ligase
MHPQKKLSVPYIQVAESRKALAYLAAAYYGFPARSLVVIGVTGTDGKTTTCNLIYQILKAAGYRVGMISTVNAVIGDRILDTGFHVTTPEALDVQRYLAEMVDDGLTHVVLEATSHGLAQYRVDWCYFDIGVVTNITHEHLDYHGTYEAYRAAKARLFTALAQSPPKPQSVLRAAILNRDDTSFSYLSGLITVPIISYGLTPNADVWAHDIQHRENGLNFHAKGEAFDTPITTGLLGEYNVSNCLAAITTTVVVLGIIPEAVQKGIAKMQSIPGRMESFDLGQDFVAIVDFAHTPNALRNALLAARELAQGRVIVVFGSAGLRDRAKRRMMAETSLEYADLTILTAEDPRTETPESILAEMAVGAESRGGVEGLNFWRIPDRGEAIRFAVSLAKAGDVVMACGKGHEQSMCFGAIEYPWDDRVAMQAALSESLHLPGPKMPVLPTSSHA